MKKAYIAIGVFILLLVVIFFTTGFFVIQPIGAVPQGVTVWYFRVGTNLPFIASPDGLSLERTGEVSLMGRLVIAGQVSNLIKNKIILRMPYLKFMYLISTGGKEYER